MRLGLHGPRLPRNRLGLGRHGLVLAVRLLVQVGPGDRIAPFAGVLETEQAKADTGQAGPQPPPDALSVEVVTE
jgi:hypothetical protein